MMIEKPAGCLLQENFPWKKIGDAGKYGSLSMGFFYSILSYLKEYILLNPIIWGILGVILWIVGAAFVKALRGKDRE